MNVTAAGIQPETDRKTYSLYEFADMMGISYRHAAELAGEGAIPGVIRLGRRVLILREAVEALLDYARDDELRALDPETAERIRERSDAIRAHAEAEIAAERPIEPEPETDDGDPSEIVAWTEQGTPITRAERRMREQLRREAEQRAERRRLAEESREPAATETYSAYRRW